MPARKTDQTSRPTVRKPAKRTVAQGKAAMTLPETMITGKASPAKAADGDGVMLTPVPPVTPVAMGKSTRGVELEMAVRRRCPEPGLLHHSDRGCTYTCEDYQTYLASHGITCSMSRRADCYDNAVMEAFFSIVKREKVERFPSYGHATMGLFDYIEVFYKQRRRHSTLGKISPGAFGRHAAA